MSGDHQVTSTELSEWKREQLMLRDWLSVNIRFSMPSCSRRLLPQCSNIEGVCPLSCESAVSTHVLFFCLFITTHQANVEHLLLQGSELFPGGQQRLRPAVQRQERGKKPKHSTPHTHIIQRAESSASWENTPKTSREVSLGFELLGTMMSAVDASQVNVR